MLLTSELKGSGVEGLLLRNLGSCTWTVYTTRDRERTSGVLRAGTLC